MSAAPAYHVEHLDPARPEHLADLATMRTAWMLEQSDLVEAAFTERLAAWWRTQESLRRIWVGRSADGTAVAMANAQVVDRMPRPGIRDTRWAYVANVWVDPAHRRRGVGRLVVDELLGWCRAEGLVRVVLNPSEVSVPFYRSLGFRAADDLMRLEL